MEIERTLTGEYLEEFIAGMQRLALLPAPEMDMDRPESEYRATQLMFLTEEQFYSHILHEIRAIDTSKGISAGMLEKMASAFDVGESLKLLPMESLSPELRALAEEEAKKQNQSLEGAAVLDPNMSAGDMGKSFAILSAALFTQRCFDECLALQEGKVQQYIEREITGFLNEFPHTGESKDQFGQEYLSLAQKHSQQPKGLRDVFRLAEIEAQKTAFEREVAAENPEMGKMQLRLKCEEELGRISKKYHLPLPDNGRRM